MNKLFVNIFQITICIMNHQITEEKARKFIIIKILNIKFYVTYISKQIYRNELIN